MDEDYITHLATIFEASEDAVICKSLDGTIKSWNKGCEKMFGYTSKEMLGKSISLIIPKESINDDKYNLTTIFNDEIVDRYETIRINKNGQKINVSLIVSDLKDTSGKITGSYQVARNITSRIKSESELVELNRELAYQNEEKGNRAAELLIANKELAFQNAEKEKRADELLIANKELSFQNAEKEKRAEELLVVNKELTLLKNDQHALIASIVNSADYAILSKTLDGIITSWNPGAEKIFGYDANEIVGKNISILIPVEFQDQEILNLKKIENGERINHYETKRVKKDGTLFNASISVSPIRNFEETIMGASNILNDITEFIKAEDNIKALTNRLQLATVSAKLGIWEWDLENNSLVWDEGMFKIYNIASNEFNSLYEGWIERLHSDDRKRIENDLQLAIANKKDYNTEFMVVWNDFSTHYLNATGIVERNDQGKAIRMIGANWDITAQKENERHLKLLESVITNTKDSILITEAEPFDEPGNKILYVNDAFTKMTGYLPSEVIGRSPRFLQGPKSDKKELKRLSKAIRKWQSFETSIINYKKNGEEFWVNFCLTPVANEKGWYTHWIAIERDVTDSKKYLSAIENQNEKLKGIAWAQSHVVRAPLARMLGIANLIKDINLDSTEYAEWLKNFIDSASELDSIIKDITVKAQTILVNGGATPPISLQ